MGDASVAGFGDNLSADDVAADMLLLYVRSSDHHLFFEREQSSGTALKPVMIVNIFDHSGLPEIFVDSRCARGIDREPDFLKTRSRSMTCVTETAEYKVFYTRGCRRAIGASSVEAQK